MWPRQRRPRPATARCELAGVDVRDLAERFGTPLFVIDEADFRSRAAEFAAAFGGRRGALRGQGVPVHRGRPLGGRGGPARWTCAAAASWPWRCAPASRPERIALHGNNKSIAELVAAVEAGRRRGWCSTRSTRSPGWTRSPASAASVAPVLVRVTVGVEAHTHEFIATAHEDQKFGFSLAGGGQRRRRGGAPGARGRRAARWSGCTATSAARSSTPRASRSPRTGWCGSSPQLHKEHGADALAALDHARPRRRLRHRLPGRRDPARRRRSWPRQLREIVKRECHAAGLDVPADRRRAGPGDRRAGHRHALRGGHAQGRRRSAAAPRAAT